MELTVDTTHTETVRHATVTGGPVLTDRYGSTVKKFRLEGVIISYGLKDDEWTLRTIQTFGTILKKDGTDSKNVFGGSALGWDGKLGWAVLQQFVDALRPTGSLELPSGPFVFDEVAA